MHNYKSFGCYYSFLSFCGAYVGQCKNTKYSSIHGYGTHKKVMGILQPELFCYFYSTITFQT